MDLLSIIYWLTLHLSPVTLYVLQFIPTFSRYTQQGWYYFLKAICARWHVEKYQKQWAEKLNNISEDSFENPKEDLRKYEADSQVIYGADTEGNYLCLKIILRNTLHAEVTIEFRHKDGLIYRLPNESQVLLCSIASRRWKAAGLTLQILDPFRRLRITYNGLMRKSQTEVEHVQFHFLWNAVGSPIRYPQEIDTHLLVEAIAREPWKGENCSRLLGDNYGYDQFGALNGFFSSKSLGEENFVYMPSWRKRCIGPAESAVLKRDFFVFAVLEDGTVFVVGAKSLKMGCPQLSYGSIFTSSGHVSSISSNNISLERLANNDEVLINVFSVHFHAHGKAYKCIAYVNNQRTSEYCNMEKNGWTMKISTADCDVNSGRAKAIVTYWWMNRGDDIVLPAPLLTPKPVENPESLYVVPLDSEECLDDKLVGGKGSSLGMLSHSLKSKKFEVPPGFVVTTTSFRHQLRENSQLLTAVNALEDICYERKEGDMEDACKITAELFAKTSITKRISEMILNELKQLEATNPEEVWKWAVRSSGLDEDSEEVSAAGQNTTILGCKTHDQVLNAVCACWGSLFSFTSVEYRMSHGLPINAEMGVVIQKMVPADCAGILCTYSPSTGDPALIAVHSNYGLGESVTSGSSDPDTVMLNRSYTDEISVSRIEMGKKQTKITLGHGPHLVEHSEVDEEMSKELSITEEQAVRLGKIGVLLEKRYGSPRNIEWAIYKDQIYLLQSGPVTYMHTWLNWELQHEFDTPIFSKTSLCTRASIGEISKGAVTPLTQTVVAKTLDAAMQVKSYQRVPNAYCFGAIIVSSHTLFFDVMNCLYARQEPQLSLKDLAIDLAVFGHAVLNEDLLKVALKRHGALTRLAAFKDKLLAFRTAWNHDKILKNVLRFNERWQIKFDPLDSPKEMLEKTEKQFIHLEKLCRLHLMLSMNTVTFQTSALMAMAEGRKELTSEHYNDLALLLATNSVVESAEIPVLLESIIASIKKANMAERFIDVHPKDGMDWLNENCPDVKEKLDDFLSAHGHRLFRELELREDTWAMDPSILIAIIQVNCLGETTTRKAKGLTAKETIAKLTSPKGIFTKCILAFLINKCRHAVASREKSKSQLVQGINRFRIAYREIAKRMVSEGHIPEEELVFHFTHDELKALLNAKSPALVQKAIRRRNLYEQWNQLRFPELNFGIPQPEQESDKTNIFHERERVKLQGTPICQGIIVARACVITDIKDTKFIQQGDVLITTSMNIAWSPYFPMLSGVVTELGGLISHGAVVAREYGLPCVVGVKNATKCFKTGDRVRLSGKNGILELLG